MLSNLRVVDFRLYVKQSDLKTSSKSTNFSVLFGTSIAKAILLGTGQISLTFGTDSIRDISSRSLVILEILVSGDSENSYLDTLGPCSILMRLPSFTPNRE